MIGANAQVVMHRPPLKRISEPRARPAGPTIVDLGLNSEGERIWRLLRQSAEGCNAIEGDE